MKLKTNKNLLAVLSLFSLSTFHIAVKKGIKMPEIEIKGKNVEEAINKGLEQLGCSKEKAKIKILDEGAAGLFGLMGAKPALVLISAPAADCKNFSAASLSEADIKDLCRKAEKTIFDIAEKMGVEPKKVKSSYETGVINAEIETGAGSFVIGKNGQTLDSIEYIAQIIANRGSDGRIKVNLDCENYRQKQKERLKIMAGKAAEYVKRTGKIYRFDPMSSKERKIIHDYIKDNPSIESFSEGEGALRKVGIKPVKKTA